MATQLTPADIPRYRDFMFPVLQALREMGGSGHVREVDVRVIAMMGLTEAQQAVMQQSGRMSVAVNRLRWGFTYLGYAGALTNTSRGVWRLTDVGWSCKESDIVELDARARAVAREAWLARKAAGTADTAGLSPAPSPELHAADEHMADQPEAQLDDIVEDGDTPSEALVPSPDLSSTDPHVWHGYLLDVLRSMPSDAFERLCQQMLRESGFVKVQVIGKSGDGGIDGIGVLQMALLSFQVFFQCKRYQGSVGASAIRDFRGAMVGRTDKGLLITTGTFTSAARQEATRDGAPVLDLIDGEALCEQLKKCGLGVTTRMVEEVTVDPEWFKHI